MYKYHKVQQKYGISINPYQSNLNAKLIITSLSFLEVWQHRCELINPMKMSWLPHLQCTSQHLEHACVYLSNCVSMCEPQQTLIMKLKVKTVIIDVNTKRSSSPSLSVSNTSELQLIVGLQSSQSDCQLVTPSRVKTTNPLFPSHDLFVFLSLFLYLSHHFFPSHPAPALITLISFLLILPVSTSLT